MMNADGRTSTQQKFISRIHGKHDFEVRGEPYVCTHIPPLVLIGIARRLAPFVRSFTSMSVAFEGMASQKAAPEGGEVLVISRAEALDRIVGGVAPVLDALAQMPEADQNYVVEACLKVTVTKRPGGGNGARGEIWTEGAGPMPSLSAGDLLGITAQVLNWELPTLWSELQELGGMFQGIVGAAASMKGA